MFLLHSVHTLVELCCSLGIGSIVLAELLHPIGDPFILPWAIILNVCYDALLCFDNQVTLAVNVAGEEIGLFTVQVRARGKVALVRV